MQNPTPQPALQRLLICTQSCWAQIRPACVVATPRRLPKNWPSASKMAVATGTALAVLASPSTGFAQPETAPVSETHAAEMAPSAASPNSLTMNAAVQKAIASHPSVRGANQQVLFANTSIDAARSGYKPQITGGLENQINSYANSSYDSRFVYTAKLNGSQMLYDFGKVASTVDKAEADVLAKAAAVDMAANQIALTTAQAWVDAHLQYTLVQIAKEQLAAVTSLTELVAERVKKGATSLSDVAQAYARVDSVRSQLLGAEAEAARASVQLMHLTGSAAPVSLAGGISDALQLSRCVDPGDVSSPPVRMAQAEVDDARAEHSLAKAQRLPTISLDGSVGYAITEGSKLYGEYRTTGQAGINVTMPLYQGGGTMAKQRGAMHQMRAAEDALDAARLEMRQGFASAKAQRDGWAARGAVFKTRIESLTVTRDLYKQQYLQLGTRTLIDLLNAEQEYHGARVEQLQGEHMQHRLALECLYFADGLRGVFALDNARSTETAPAAKAASYGPTFTNGNFR